MADLRTLLFAVAASVFLTAPAVAADLPVKIGAARVGLPPDRSTAELDESGQAGHIAKFARWAPIYVDLELTSPITDPAELVIEAADPDEILTTLVVPINFASVKPGERIAAASLGTIGYVRPGGSGEVTIRIRGANGGRALAEPYRVRSLRPRDPLKYVVLSLGSPFAGFDLPKPVGGEPELNVGLRGGRVLTASITDVSQLPDQWFGYDTADLVVLQTGPGSDEFLRKLFSETASPADKAKQKALAEWIRRGGRIVVTVGANASLVSQLPALQDFLPFTINAASPFRTVGTLVAYWGARESSQTSTYSGALTVKGTTFPVANLVAKADRPGRILIPPPDRQGDIKDTLAGQWAYGLGRVTVIGIDLDRSPFLDFSLRPEFWDWVLREGGAARASTGSEGKPLPGSGTLTEEEDEVAVALRTHNDTFDGVPVVSFGWIAFLIVLYILLIGPIEYFFLKRVLGRLELTWITFPIIVLTVSLAAYFTAFSLKGRDLKINKIDLVEIDPASGRAYGTTFFTIFSPRIDNYTLAVTPGEGWSADSTPPGTVISWIGAPRGGRASLLRRSYQYHSDETGLANGLEKVPIQVWSTKSFVANWSSRLSPETPGVVSRLEHPPGDPTSVIGSFVNHLPIPLLSDCVAFYAGYAYPIPGGTIRAGETIRLVFDRKEPAMQWLQKESALETRLLAHVQSSAPARPGAQKGAGPQVGTGLIAGGPLPLLGLLFHESSLRYGEGTIARNASLRQFDQSWRLNTENRNEVILVGRVATATPGPAEETLSGANSPSRLWLRSLPDSGAARDPIPGTGQQETWVRMYLPIK